MVRLTVRPDRALDVYRGRKTTIQYLALRQGLIPRYRAIISDNKVRPSIR